MEKIKLSVNAAETADHIAIGIEVIGILLILDKTGGSGAVFLNVHFLGTTAYPEIRSKRTIFSQIVFFSLPGKQPVFR